MADREVLAVDDDVAQCSRGRTGEHVAVDERSLIDAAREGDPDAYGELYRRHHGAVLRLAVRLGRDRHEAEDVTSDVFCNMLRALQSGSGPRDECRAYLLRSVRHTLIKLRTRKDTGRADPRPTPELDGHGSRVEPHDAADLADGPATDALRHVSDRFRDVLWFVEVQGYDSTDVALGHEIARPAAASMLYRARRALRRAYLNGCVATPPSDDRCLPVRALLASFVDGDVATPGADRVRDHLAECIACNQALNEMNAVHDRFGARWWLALLPGALRLGISGAARPLVTAVGGSSTLFAAAALTMGALTLPASAMEAPTSLEAPAVDSSELPEPTRGESGLPGSPTGAAADDGVADGMDVGPASPEVPVLPVLPVAPSPVDSRETSTDVVGDIVPAPITDDVEAIAGINAPGALTDVVDGAEDVVVAVVAVADDVVTTVGDVAATTVSGAADRLESTVEDVTELVDETADVVVGPDGIVDTVAGPTPVAGAVDGASGTATDALDDLVSADETSVLDVVGLLDE